MLIYKDIISGDEMVSDTYVMKLIDDMYYEVVGKQVTYSTNVDDVDIGANASAEDAAEEVDGAASQSGIDVILANRLVTTNFTKKDFKIYIAKFTKAVHAKLVELDADLPEENKRAATFKAKFPNVIKMVLEKFKDWEFYTGESMNSDGMVALLDWRDDDKGNEQPILVFFKDALVEEKV